MRPLLQQIRRPGHSVLAIIALLLSPPSHAADLNSQALAIFTAKCADCHSPLARKIKKFGHVNDLSRLASDAKLISPGNPAKSALWKSIEQNDMPPDDSGIDPLNPEQKETIRQWILSLGSAPATGPSTTQPANPAGSAEAAGSTQAQPRAPKPFLERLLRLTGKLHPLAAHFPIALVMAALVAEGMSIRSRQSSLDGTVRFCLTLGGIGAAGTAILGWIRSLHYSTSQTALLDNHRLLGTFAAVWFVILAILCQVGFSRAQERSLPWTGRSRLAFRIGLVACVAFIALAAHMGGTLVFGEDHFSF